MSQPTSTSSPHPGTNLAILVGVLSRDAELRSLPSGDHLVALELTVRPEGARAESVPVSWPGAPGSAATWEAGEELLVTGRVRRRYFRAGGSTQSRTEVVATRIVPTRRRAAAGKALDAALASLPAGL
ncbi:MAG: single-stranded DNA-binding protein [Acidimicrobiales bacterium]